MSSPLGMSLNNPGNLRDVGIKWQGMVRSGDGFCCFDTLANGLRAMAIDLCNAQKIHERFTIRSIITAFAPPSENNTDAYIRNVCADTQCGPDETFHLERRDRLFALMQAVIRQEQGLASDGSPLCSAAQINQAITDAYTALGWPLDEVST